jgi:hypothetical protein
VLLLLTFRPDFEPPWPARAHLLPVALGRLGRRQAKELVAAAAGEVLPGDVVDRLAVRSDGIPLFVEELAKGVLESGPNLARSLSGLEIPETLEDSLMARLDRLGEAKQVAQLGAAIGREFPYALLARVAPMKEAALREGLARLVEAELVYPRGLPPKATYTFKHALVQDTTYQSLLESQRREMHGRIADAMEQHFPERVGREPEAIARHCDAVGRTALAIGHYQRAGERASQLSAHEEAIGQLQRALELLGTLPETRERDRQELRLLARDRAGARGEVPRAAGRDEPGPPAPRPGTARRGPRPPPARLRLVHRRLRDRPPEGRPGAARRALVGRRAGTPLRELGMGPKPSIPPPASGSSDLIDRADSRARLARLRASGRGRSSPPGARRALRPAAPPGAAGCRRRCRAGRCGARASRRPAG